MFIPIQPTNLALNRHTDFFNVKAKSSNSTISFKHRRPGFYRNLDNAEYIGLYEFLRKSIYRLPYYKAFLAKIGASSTILHHLTRHILFWVDDTWTAPANASSERSSMDLMALIQQGYRPKVSNNAVIDIDESDHAAADQPNFDRKVVKLLESVLNMVNAELEIFKAEMVSCFLHEQLFIWLG